MDLYGINPVLGKGYSDRSHFNRNEGPPSGAHNKISKFVNNDLLSSAAWSSVIHQPSQDSEPEDLPSTVDINAIKEPPTPVNASAQTPLAQLHGDYNSFALNDDQNVAESGSDSDSESDSGNSDNEIENPGSGADSGSCSDSDSVSSHRSSCSSRSKQLSSHSSRSNSPTCVNENSHKPFTLPKNCDLSEDSDDGEDVPSITENETKKETEHAAEKGPHSSEQLEVIDEDDLAAVFSNAKQMGRSLETPDFPANKKSVKTVVEAKRIPSAFSDSSSDSEMLPKEVVRDAINSIHVEPRSPPFSPSNSHSRYPDRDESSTLTARRSLTKDAKNTWAAPPLLCASVEGAVPANAKSRASGEIFQVQEKRGPGRPRKKKINGKVKVGKEQSKCKKKNVPTTAPYRPLVKAADAFIPAFPTQNEWLKKHKKRKKKDAKEKMPNLALVKEVDNLANFFSNKCMIKDEKSLADVNSKHHPTHTRSKLYQRSKDKNKKRKHSDKESESEAAPVVPHASTNETKSKRRHKKSATETPKVHHTNFDQRLPLKKRHYHVSASSTGPNSGHQTQNSSKTRVEKHVAENQSEESHKVCDERSSSAKPNEFTNLPPTLSSMKKEKPRKRMKDVDTDMPPVLDEYSKQPDSLSGNTFAAKAASSLLCANAPSLSKKPELITPIPNESSSSSSSTSSSAVMLAPILKPPAGVFEPTRKLPASLSKCKKTSIDDMLCKLKEKLEGLESPSKNTSSLIEKIGGSVPTDENCVPFKRVLRPKRANIEKEKEKENPSAKKNKIFKDVTICLLKLPIANSSQTNEQEAGKPKISKRRKARNRTGFPVLKKKKKKHPCAATSTGTSTSDVSDTVLSADGEVTVSNESKIENSALGADDENQVKEKREVHVSKDSKEKEKLEVSTRVEEKSAVKSSRKSQIREKAREKDTVPEAELPKTRERGKVFEMEVETPSRSLRKREPPKESTNQVKAKRSKIESKPKQAVTETKKVSSKSEDANCPAPESRTLRKREPPKLEPAKPTPVVENKKKDTKKPNNALIEKAKEEPAKESKAKKEVKVKEEPEKDEMSDDSKKDIAPRKKRKYAPAGLFSDYYKENRTAATDFKNRFFQYKPEDHPHGLLPPPPYFENFLRRRQIDFKLPYDLWWLQTYDKLPGRDIVESWKYKRIRMNVYYDVKPPHGYEAQACNCKVPEEKDKLGCGDDCINRVLYAECSPDLCPLKERCSNQRIQKHNGDMKLIKYMTKDKGIGVKTQKLIKAGQYIVEYVGEVVTDKEFKNRMTSLYKNDIHHYCLNLEGGLLIDGHRMGSDARFVNHSCEPNCEIQKWSVNGRFRMGLFAQRDIEPGEELTYDYNFSLFNPEEGQPCRCGSKECRGVIGGKSQRVSVVNASVNNIDTSSSTNAPQAAPNCATSSKNSRIRPRKQARKKSNTNMIVKSSARRDSDSSNRVLPRRNALPLMTIEPLTEDEKAIVRAHRVFLERSLTKIQRVREKMKRSNEEEKNSTNGGAKQNGTKNGKPKQSIEFMRHLNAFTQQRFIKTRGLAQAEDDPEINKTLQLANLFRTIYTFVVSAKDEKSGETFSSFFMTLPSKQKLHMYYQRIEEPIDLTMVEKNIVTGVYKDVESFDKDMNKLIANNVKYYGRTSEHGIAAVRLRKAYHIAKLDHISQIEEITGQSVPASFRPVQENPGDEEEDVIRCICGLFNDEGMMIQCERCLVWQHIGCVKASTDAEHYHCERCSSREVDYEIPLDVPPPEIPSPDEKHYLTLMRDDLQIRQGDTVYILRDIRNPETNTRLTYRTVETFKYEDCDILRVEQLWKTKSGEKYAFGHHYLRPCETFHEPTRKFFPNELLKRSVYETVPLDLIMGRCYVLDLRTYCKGRPIDADPEHIYICEYSVNKEMNTFYKMKSKQPCPVSTKSYAFETYDTRLRPTRTYTPHMTPPTGSSQLSTSFVASKSTAVTNQNKTRTGKPKEVAELPRPVETTVENSVDEDDVPLARIKDAKLEKQKQHLNTILLKLLAKKPCKAPLDVSYLLEMGRRNRGTKKSTTQ